MQVSDARSEESCPSGFHEVSRFSWVGKLSIRYHPEPGFSSFKPAQLSFDRYATGGRSLDVGFRLPKLVEDRRCRISMISNKVRTITTVKGVLKTGTHDRDVLLVGVSVTSVNHYTVKRYPFFGQF
jgi:hypothetical protein